MFKSDIVIGWSYFAATQFIEDNDLWDEVIHIVVDKHGRVSRIWH